MPSKRGQRQLLTSPLTHFVQRNPTYGKARTPYYLILWEEIPAAEHQFKKACGMDGGKASNCRTATTCVWHRTPRGVLPTVSFTDACFTTRLRHTTATSSPSVIGTNIPSLRSSRVSIVTCTLFMAGQWQRELLLHTTTKRSNEHRKFHRTLHTHACVAGTQML